MALRMITPPRRSKRLRAACEEDTDDVAPLRSQIKGMQDLHQTQVKSMQERLHAKEEEIARLTALTRRRTGAPGAYREGFSDGQYLWMREDLVMNDPQLRVMSVSE